MKIDANSQPIEPPPTIRTFSGTRSSFDNPSESKMSGSSNAMFSGRDGREPVAIRIFLDVKTCSLLGNSLGVNITV